MKQNIKVLIFHPALAPSRVDLFNALGFRFLLRVVFLRDNLLNQRFDQKKLRNKLAIDHKYLSKGFTVRARSFRFGIGKEIREFEPHVVVTHELSPVTLTTAIQKKIRSQQFRHVIWSADNFLMATGGSFARNLLKRLLLPVIDGLIVYTPDVANIYRKKLSYTGPIGQVPNIHKEASFFVVLQNSEEEAINTMQSYGLNGRRVILFVGRLSQEKRIDRLINAFAGIAARRKDTILVLVGDGRERPALEQLVQRLAIEDRVIFTGRHEGSSLAAWYLIGSLFVLTSEFEPFGAVVNESLLAGMPVLCSDRAGAKNLIKEGENGSVIAPEDTLPLQTEMLKWIDRSPPVSPAQLTEPRPSLMPLRFQDAVDAYARLLKEVGR